MSALAGASGDRVLASSHDVRRRVVVQKGRAVAGAAAESNGC